METIERTIQNDEIEIDLREVFFLLKSKLLVILTSIVLFATAGGLICEFIVTPKYASTTRLYIMSNAGSMLAGLSLSDLQVGASLTNDYEELIQSRPAVEAVIDKLGLDITYEEMLTKMTIGNKENTRILSITIEDTDPRMAKKIADTFADVAITRLSEIMAIDEPHLAEQGHVMEHSINQDLRKFVLLGALAGAVLSIGAVMLAYLLNDTIHSAEDVEKYLALNTLATIPLGEEEYNGHEKKGIFSRLKRHGRRKK